MTLEAGVYFMKSQRRPTRKAASPSTPASNTRTELFGFKECVKHLKTRQN